MYKWKGSGLESLSLQSHEPLIIAEGSQMWVVHVSVVTGLAVLTCSCRCKSLLAFPGTPPLMKRLLLVHPQRWITHGWSLRTVTLSPGLFFLPRDITYTYCDPPCLLPTVVLSCITPGLSVTEALPEYPKYQWNYRGREVWPRTALLY